MNVCFIQIPNEVQQQQKRFISLVYFELINKIKKRAFSILDKKAIYINPSFGFFELQSDHRFFIPFTRSLCLSLSLHARNNENNECGK